MTLYTFRCPQCEFGFEVSRRMSEAGKEVTCPWDGASCDRVFTPVAFNRDAAAMPSAAQAPPVAGNWSHFGHSHGTGVAGHSHSVRTPPPPAEPGSQ